jgi:hypothetical protein
MFGEAKAKYKAQSIEKVEKGFESLGRSKSRARMLVKDNSDGIPLSYKVEKEFRNLSAENARCVRENAEFHARLTDLEGTNKEQKMASILWFGEQGKQEHIAVLEELEKDEDEAEIKFAYKKAMLRLDERINSNNSIDEDEILLDDSDVYVSPVISSIKVKMKARMKGRVEPLPIEEDDVLLDDSDTYVSPVITSIRVKMKARMKGRV